MTLQVEKKMDQLTSTAMNLIFLSFSKVLERNSRPTIGSLKANITPFTLEIDRQGAFIY